MPVGPEAGQRASTIEGQIARVADIIAYVNHDIDDATRAGLIRTEDLPARTVSLLGRTSSDRIGAMVTDAVLQTLEGGLTEVRMSDEVLEATLELRSFLFESVYENDVATAEFRKATGILGGLWEKVHERAEEFLEPRTIQTEGIDAAARDFLAGMTDRYAIRLFEQLFIPKPWVDLRAALP
jgi:dGTPase